MSASRAVGIVKAAQFTDRLLKIISEKGFQIAGSVMLAGITLLIFVNIIFRYLLNQPIDCSQEIVEVILSLIVYWGIAVCTSRQGHIAIDVMVKRFSPKVQAVVGSIIYFLTTALFGIMTWRFFKYAFDHPEPVTNILRLPNYIFVIIIGLTSIVITLLFFAQFIQILKRAVSKCI